MGKVVSLVTEKKSEECFLRIDGPPEGYGPFHIAWNGVSSQMLLVLEEHLAKLKAGLYEIIQEEGDAED